MTTKKELSAVDKLKAAINGSITDLSSGARNITVAIRDSVRHHEQHGDSSVLAYLVGAVHVSGHDVVRRNVGTILRGIGYSVNKNRQRKSEREPEWKVVAVSREDNFAGLAWSRLVEETEGNGLSILNTKKIGELFKNESLSDEEELTDVEQQAAVIGAARKDVERFAKKLKEDGLEKGLSVDQLKSLIYGQLPFLRPDYQQPE